MFASEMISLPPDKVSDSRRILWVRRAASGSGAGYFASHPNIRQFWPKQSNAAITSSPCEIKFNAEPNQIRDALDRGKKRKRDRGLAFYDIRPP